MIKVIVAGAAGRMGRELVKATVSADNCELVGAFERPGHPAIGQDAGVLAGVDKQDLAVAPSLAEAGLDRAEVIIDFTAPEATLANLDKAVEAGVKMVIGTTGFSEEQRVEIDRAARSQAVVLAPNMALGVNVLFKLAAMAAKLLGPGHDLEIMETHHHFKADAPSGTAVKLAELMAEARGWKLDDVGVFSREGIIGPRKEAEIGVQAVRAGGTDGVVGEHTVYLVGAGERLELTHRAFSRGGMAAGAVRAAGWVVGRKPGLYDMQDVLGLK